MLVIGIACVAGGMVVCGLVGLVVGLARPGCRRGRAAGMRGSAAALGMVLGAALGAVLGCGGFGYWMYDSFGRDGPPHGYTDRAAYRAAELEAQGQRLAPLIAAIERYRTEHGHYPPRLDALVEGGYVDALPPQDVTVDHLGEPDRVTTNRQWYWYLASPAGDQFALNVQCWFREDQRWMTHHREYRVYRPGGAGWQPGTAPPWPAAGGP